MPKQTPIMTHIEGNKLIAEFMGCYGDTHWSGGEEVFRYGFKDTHITERWHESCFDENTPYHTSWDWLMPVVEKMYLLRCVENITIKPGLTQIWLTSGDYIQSPCLPENDSITECWLAVTDFIKWYNKSKS